MYLRKSIVLIAAVVLFVAPEASAYLSVLKAEAESLRPQVSSRLGKAFLDATGDLPSIGDRDEDTYYGTFHGTSLAYIRPIEILGQAGLDSLSGKRVFDLGYGSIGQLRLWASLGAQVVGVEVDPFLTELYSQPSDTGEIPRAKSAGDGPNGHLTLIEGYYPSDAQVVKAVGRGHDLIIAKNVLKYGYIHPEQEVDQSMLIHLGVGDEEFVQLIYDSLNKGGFFMMYNLAPAPNQPGKPYIPWADGRCPFERALLERIGFRVIEYNRDDARNAHEMARALGWDKGRHKMDLEKDLFSHYTLLIKD